MKKAILISLVFFNVSIYAQIEAVGDTFYDYQLNFEQNYNEIQIGDALNSIWEIGLPSKTIFDSAYSSPFAIVTDTLHNYPANNYSYFDLFITNNNFPGFDWQMQIEFRHRFNTDTLRDGGYISISYDTGASWKNVMNDSITTWEEHPGFYYDINPTQDWGFINYENPNTYTLEDTLFNGEIGFSGNSNGWVKTRLSWYGIPVKSMNYDNDTIILRFSFVSDEIENNMEGWMIDDIRLYQVDLGSGFNIIEDKNFILYPNPSKDYITVKNLLSAKKIEIYNIKGQLVFNSEILSLGEKTSIDISSLEAGLYFVKIGSNLQKLLLE